MIKSIEDITSNNNELIQLINLLIEITIKNKKESYNNNSLINAIYIEIED